MAIIKPISILRNKSNEIANLAQESDEPIYITKNGEGNLVIMSVEHYRKMQAKMDLISKLTVAQSQLKSDTKRTNLKELSLSIRHRLNEKKAKA